MRTMVVLFVVGLMLSVSSARVAGAADANATLARYLSTAIPKGPSKTDRYDPVADREVNGARLARLAILKELAAMPDDALTAAEPAIFNRASPQQRYEIVSMLGDTIQTSACAALLHRVLRDVRKGQDDDATTYEELVRSSAVMGLSRMSSRTDRSGGKRLVRGEVHEPKVPGLVPYLIEAAHDKSARVREFALYGMADSLDPAAVTELKTRLKDDSEGVRLKAACFLTEYMDASGLTEMRLALARLRKPEANKKDSLDYWIQVEMLLASFERITGKSFGEIPLNPDLSGIAGGGEKEYRELMDAWAAWWDWRPEPKIVQAP